MIDLNNETNTLKIVTILTHDEIITREKVTKSQIVHSESNFFTEPLAISYA